MNNSNSIQYQNLSHRVQVLEKAVKEVLEMNTILHLEINMLKKKITDQNGTSNTSSSDENKHSTQQSDVDNVQLQQIMAMRKAQMSQQQMHNSMASGRSINISRN
jgi:regulator of replication initiation timing